MGSCNYAGHLVESEDQISKVQSRPTRSELWAQLHEGPHEVQSLNTLKSFSDTRNSMFLYRESKHSIMEEKNLK